MTPPATVFTCAFSNDGSLLAAGDSRSALNVWETSSVAGEVDKCQRFAMPLDTTCRMRTNARAGPIYSVVFAENRLVSGGDLSIKVWDIDCVEEPLLELVNPQGTTAAGGLTAVSETNGLAYCSETRALFSASGQAAAFQWDLSTGQVVMRFAGHDDYLHCISMGVTPSTILTGSEDGFVRLWDIRSGECEAVLAQPGGKHWISSICCYGDWMSCGSGSGSLFTYHVASRSLVQTYTAAPPILAVSHVDSSLVSAGGSPYVNVWNADGTERNRIAYPVAPLYDIAVNPDPAARFRMATCGASSTVALVGDPMLPPSTTIQVV
ncbi:WD domain, G-beta repeat [Plasmodiophora brassicae]|nr:hypothetical protein PBRA_004534 [Plasmodiophora brassicae]